MSIEPDTKDWTWVIEEPCQQCGFDPAEVVREELADLIHENTRGWYDVLADADFAVRPAPHVWSRLEYACHVRDVHELFATRVQLMLDEDDPTFENWDQDATAVGAGLRPAGPRRGRHRRWSSGRPRSRRSTRRSRATSGSAPGAAATVRCSPSRRWASTTCTTWSTTCGTSPAAPSRPPVPAGRPVRHTEFWVRMETALGPTYARSWARQHVLSELDERTVEEALADGTAPKVVWRAVWAALELPARER